MEAKDDFQAGLVEHPSPEQKERARKEILAACKKGPLLMMEAFQRWSWAEIRPLLKDGAIVPHGEHFR